jgi:membrane protein implicated in regulation of membrane protease activity
MLWWIVAGLLVAAELATGTFYLLMLALGCAAAGLCALAGLGDTLQVVVAAVVGGGATAAWHLKRLRSPRAAPAESNRDVNIDIGQSLQVPAWQPDGSARVSYRGAAWAVRYAGQGTPAPGPHVIVALRGSELQVTPAEHP